MKNVYCIIATYNGQKWIKNCLKSLAQSSRLVNIIVVDNASTDGTAGVIESGFPETDVIRLEKNLGFGAANNIGIKKALKKGADYLLLLNMDAVVETNSIEILVRAAEQNSSYGIISPMHLNGDGTGLDFLFSTYLDPVKCPGLMSDMYIGKTKEIYPVFRVNAACWLLSAEVVKRVGLFDDNFFMYGEDDNFSDRVNWHGYKIGVVPDAKMYHYRLQQTDKKQCVPSDTRAQISKAKVVALNPNQTKRKKVVYLFRKSFSYLLTNVQEGRFLSFFGNAKSFIVGVFYIFRFDKKYKKQSNPVQD